MDLLSGVSSWLLGMFGMGGGATRRENTNANWNNQGRNGSSSSTGYTTQHHQRQTGSTARSNSSCGKSHRNGIQPNKAGTRMPIYDLHGVLAGDVRKRDERFLKENRKAPQVKIITGRGLHSKDGKPVNKMITQNYLKENGYTFTVKDKGGSVIVKTKRK